MLKIVPIKEEEATGEIRTLYASIKTTLGGHSVPLVFQYLAVFPQYFRYLWEQASPNLTDPAFQSQTQQIIRFAQTAIAGVYSPSPRMEVLLERLHSRPEEKQLDHTCQRLLRMNAALYLLSLAIRESLKGKYLGIKQIGPTLSNEEKRIFYTVLDADIPIATPEPQRRAMEHPSSALVPSPSSQTGALTTTLYAEFFASIEQEMQELIKKESYLSRRVELERFTLAKLPLLPYPLDSSFVSMTRKSGEHPQFPELVYLLGEIFPTQTPYKLMASSVMYRALCHREPDVPTSNANTRSTAVSLENVRD